MASGSPLDEQRKERWPNLTSTMEQGPKVNLPEEENTDSSDMEGIFGPGVSFSQPEGGDDEDEDEMEV